MHHGQLDEKMELSRENFRAIIFYDFRVELSQQECFNRLHSDFGEEAPSMASVYIWYNEFKRGWQSLKDEPREGREISAVTPEHIDAVKNLKVRNGHVTYREIEASLGISMTYMRSILHVDLVP
ncbi:uncharacterized protein LOC129577085 [Sitodiplosis mosellana]|uniref:uncharacterized protein LOC129577085 n=1 Tax=Sitodiplosis mosellana TaxID=263140 RepID=UPI0024444D25|nr:uncharacterized protein LOC129577085 [Sitodiplosis mosellana]